MDKSKPWQTYNTVSTLLKLKLTSLLWQSYDVADTDEEAATAFVTRYGREPRLVWRDGGCVHVGPITKEEHDGKMAGPGTM